MRGDPNETSAESLARQRAHRAMRGVKQERTRPRTPRRLATSGPAKRPMPPSYTDADGVVRADKRVLFDPTAHAWFTNANPHSPAPWFRPNMFQREDDPCC